MTPIEFVEELAGNFYPPQKWDDEIAENWSRRTIREVRDFSPEVRQRALDQIMRDASDRRMPMLRDILIACRNAQRFIDMQANQNKLPLEVQQSEGYIDQARKLLARSIMNSDLGRKALDEGWHGAMYHYILRNGRGPLEKDEQRQCRMIALEFEQLVSEINSGKFIDKQGVERKYTLGMQAAVTQFYNSILGKWDEAREMVTGEPDIPAGITEDVN